MVINQMKPNNAAETNTGPCASGALGPLLADSNTAVTASVSQIGMKIIVDAGSVMVIEMQQPGASPRICPRTLGKNDLRYEMMRCTSKPC